MITTTEAPARSPFRRIGAVVLKISTVVAMLVGLGLSFTTSDPEELPELVVNASLGSGR